MRRVSRERLKRAFENRELQVHYQPKLHLETSSLQGVEALLRWRTPAGESIAPATFVPLLEQAGLIGEVGAWIFEQAAEDAAWWRQCGLDIGRIAINVSPLQLRCADFLPWVLNRCGSWASQGTVLDIELTESALLSDPGHVAHAMEALVGANVRFALDDFGMGYSSLDLLMRLPVSYLKIDRSFVARMLTSGKAAALVEAIVRMGHEIGVETIAEGVETAEQLQRLWELHCEIGQGHYFCAAMPRERLLEWHRTRPFFRRPRPEPVEGDAFISGRHWQVAAAIAAAGHDIT
jgi:EAL domain-containing protein (putative c-di-GMP-specific phosphodiesterase class I)